MERFWEKVEVHVDGCWLWTAAVQSNGYGRFRVGALNGYAHRFAYELTYGPIPNGLQLDHLCRVRHCVRPDHLEPVTSRENTRRGIGNASKTHCVNGHPLTGDNLLPGQLRRGLRTCRICVRNSRRRYVEKNRALGYRM